MLWSVIAKCSAKNNGIWEDFEKVIAQFNDSFHAEDFINKCLPASNRDKFTIRSNDGKIEYKPL